VRNKELREQRTMSEKGSRGRNKRRGKRRRVINTR